MSFEIIISKKANQDLQNIIDYYYKISPKYCKRVFDSLDSSILNLKQYAKLGKQYKQNRLLVCNNYVIVYKLLENKLIILTIAHSNQNFQS